MFRYTLKFILILLQVYTYFHYKELRILTTTESFLKLLDFEYSESFLSFLRSITNNNENKVKIC